MKKQKIISILIMLFILTILTGYAIFRVAKNSKIKNPPINYIDVDFTKIGKIEEQGSSGASAYISKNRRYVTINVPDLQYEGAYATIPIEIKNVGLIPAKLRLIKEYGIDYSLSGIKVDYSGIGISDLPLYPGDKSKIFVTVKLEDVTKKLDVQFRIDLYYTQ